MAWSKVVPSVLGLVSLGYRHRLRCIKIRGGNTAFSFCKGLEKSGYIGGVTKVPGGLIVRLVYRSGVLGRHGYKVYNAKSPIYAPYKSLGRADGLILYTSAGFLTGPECKMRGCGGFLVCFLSS
jgi:ribosomal protein S8